MNSLQESVNMLFNYDPQDFICDYKFIKMLGSGGFGSVHLAINLKGQKVVVKEMNSSKLRDDDYTIIDNQRIPTEIILLYTLKGFGTHDVVQMTKWFKHGQMLADSEPGEPIKFEDVYVIIFEWDESVKSDLYGYIKKKGRLLEKEVKFIIREYIRILRELKEKEGIIIRDNKDENLLIRESANGELIGITLCDLGGSFFASDQPAFSWQQGTAVWNSTRWYLGKPYDPAYDYVWAIGIFIYTMLTDKLPFDDDSFLRMKLSDAKLFRMLQESVLTKEPKYPKHISQACVDLIKKCLDKDETRRIAFEEITAHPWFQGESLI